MLYFFLNTKIQNARFSPEPYILTAQQERILETYRRKKKDAHLVIDEKTPLSLISKVIIASSVLVCLIIVVLGYIFYSHITPNEKLIAQAQQAQKDLPDSTKHKLTTQITHYKESPTEENKEKLQEQIIESKSWMQTMSALKTAFANALFLSYQENEETLLVLIEKNGKYNIEKASKLHIKFPDMQEKIQFSYKIYTKKSPSANYKIVQSNTEITEDIKNFAVGDYTVEILAKIDKNIAKIHKSTFTLY
jgi:hypothetical protein